MNDTVLNIKDLSVTYHSDMGKVNAVNKISFDIKRGESFGIVGESGCGKSTVALSLMRLFNERHVDLEGEINYQEKNILELSKGDLRALRGNQIAMIFQDPMTSLNPYLKIGLQVAESLMLHKGLSYKDALKEAISLLDSVGIPNPQSRVQQHPHEFSGGMRQRAMIASAISCQPDILIADEPTTALDVITQEQVLKLIKDLQIKNNMSLILITHDLGVVANTCDRVAVMFDGEIVELNTVQEIFNNPQHDYTKALLAAVPRIDRKQARLNSIENSDEQKEISKRTISDTIVVRTENISVTFQDKGFFSKGEKVEAVKNVSLDLHEGEVLGLVGQSGSGKSTFIRACLGIAPMSNESSVIINGTKIEFNDKKQLRAYRKDCQMIFQDPFASLNPRMTVAQIVAEPLINYRIMNRKDADKRVVELLEKVKFNPDWRVRFPHEFSGGQRQRVGIARALALNPKILYCDEPVSALDVSVQADVINLLKDLQAEMNLSMIFISHDLAVVRHIADRIAVMHEGEIV
ncbi:MAG: ABC transporter ATP-binding protein [Lentisphaeria bacterium]|nr:ABC transporter ATP-binding protein [Lentisphaeria bacterium]